MSKLDLETGEQGNGSASWKVRGARLAVVVVGLGLWFLTQSLIGSRELSGDDGSAGGLLTRGDGLLALTASINRFLHDHDVWANGLLIISSAFIDLLALFLIARGIFGASIRPMLGLIILFALRQLLQGLSALPAPEGMIWRDPGFPSLLVTYGVANDFFFSGHTAIAVYAGLEMARLGGPWFRVLGLAVILFEAFTVIALRAHYTMDVFTGALAAIYVAGLAGRMGPRCDRLIGLIAGSPANNSN